MTKSVLWTRERRLLLVLALMVVMLATTACNLPSSGEDGETEISGAPLVSIAAPRPNASYLEGVSVNIQAAIDNAGDDIARVEITVGDSIIAAQENPNTGNARRFSITQSWTATGIGQNTIGVTAFRTDGTSSDTATVIINVLSAEPTATPTEDELPTLAPPTEAPTTAPQPTDPPEPEEPAAPPATNTPSVPTALFTTGINVRSGPSTNFTPPIGQFAANQTAEILAQSLDGSWLKVRYGSGEGWVYTPLVEIQGSIANVPREAGPPPPPPPTPVPPTNPPPPAQDPAQPTQPPTTSQANLTGSPPGLNPGQPVCNQQFSVLVNITNSGSAPTSGPATVRFQNVHVGSGEPQGQSFDREIPVLQPGQNHVVGGEFNISTHYNTEHRIVVTIDPDNRVAESNPNDNVLTATYTLQQGGC